MTENQLLLRAILDDPDDDGRRLVYADWLEERGDVARAEFIRVQVELAALPAYDPRWAERRRREQALLRQHGPTWRREVQSWARPGAVFRRGFVAEVRASLAEFLRGAGGLFRRAPVRAATFLNVSPERLGALAASPVLAELTGLRVASVTVAVPALLALVGSPHVAGLRRLRLHLTDDQPEVARALAAATHLARLEHLRLDGWGHFGDAGAAALAGSPHLAGLATLRLNNNAIGEAGVRALLTSPFLTALTTLGLTAQQLHPRAAAALAEGLPRLRLRELDLSHNRELGPGGALALAAWGGLADLTVLRLAECGIGADGARALACCARLTELRQLVLSKNQVGDEGALALARSPYLGQLAVLNLWGNPLGIDAVEALAASPCLPRLCSLVVDHRGTGRGDWGRLKRRFGPKVLSVDEAWSFASELGTSADQVTRLDDFPDLSRE
jgi:uncharacterized protein (TIGR02996 family)